METGWDPKDPDAKKDYVIDWTEYLDGDTLSTSTWTVVTAAATLVVMSNPAPSIVANDAGLANQMTKAWLEAGTDGVDYEVRNRITTAGGRTDDRTARLQVRTQ